MNEVSESEIAAVLTDTDSGLSLDHYFLIGESTEQAVPTFWLPGLGLRFNCISDNRLAQACKRFLHRRGVRRFANINELFLAAVAEQWPEWEKHVPADFRH